MTEGRVEKEDIRHNANKQIMHNHTSNCNKLKSKCKNVGWNSRSLSGNNCQLI